MTTTWMLVDSPLGPLRLVARGDRLIGLQLPPKPTRSDGVSDVRWHGPPAAEAPGRERPPVQWGGETRGDDPVLCAAAAQIADYFAGRRTGFDLPLAPEGTPFQQRVWAALQTIPFGATWSYGRLAAAVGNPRSPSSSPATG
jgi:methylated-DNA-[protein]-cysteine S-methyltransferase